MSNPEINPDGFPHVEGVTVTRFAPGQEEPAGFSMPGLISAHDLDKLEFEDLKYAVPGYIAEGLTLLVGMPKLGKSWLCLDMSLAVAAGRSCLGVECEEGDVLYLTLEDNLRRLQTRIRKLCELEDGTPIPKRLQLAPYWPRSNKGGTSAIRDWIAFHPGARLVIIDVLSMFKSDSATKDQTLYNADYNSLKELQDLGSDTGVAIVVVHHTRKMAAVSDPFEKVSGTTGLSGAADTVMILDRDQKGCTLYGRGREIEEIETAVLFDKSTCRWRALGDVAVVRRTDERSVILTLIGENRAPMSPAEVADALSLPRNNVKQLLFKMAKNGEVLKGKRGMYLHPDHAGNSDEPMLPGNFDNRNNQEEDE